LVLGVCRSRWLPRSVRLGSGIFLFLDSFGRRAVPLAARFPARQERCRWFSLRFCFARRERRSYSPTNTSSVADCLLGFSFCSHNRTDPGICFSLRPDLVVPSYVLVILLSVFSARVRGLVLSRAPRVFRVNSFSRVVLDCCRCSIRSGY
jgi:hypothetical protein